MGNKNSLYGALFPGGRWHWGGGGVGPLDSAFLRWFRGERHQQQQNNDDNNIQRFGTVAGVQGP